MTISILLQVIGVVVGASWGCYAVEQATGLHPVAVRGAQVGMCALAGCFVARVLGLL